MAIKANGFSIRHSFCSSATPIFRSVIARLIAPRLAEALRQPVIIENKPGASGTIGANFVAKAPPDGYTLLLSNNASIATGPLVYAKIEYDPLGDFEHVLMVSSFANGFLVNANHPAKTLREFIAMAKAAPGKMTFASAAVGSAGHLTGEMMKQRTGIDMQHVPYKGTGPAITDLMAGQIDAIFDGLPASTPYVKSGKLRLLAVSAPQRLPNYPDIPTLNEMVPGVTGFAWFGISAPAKTPQDILERIELELQKILALAEVRARFADLGMNLSGRGRSEYVQFISQDIQRWAPVVKTAGVSVDR
ncbi:MAG: tripartite tricarboxylate transporter substrate binding protein [Proteobacteria bacterium]|nr:tripartite tricarboxylate transporter substrate binding protein [Pseudomonadota bacterium]